MHIWQPVHSHSFILATVPSLVRLSFEKSARTLLAAPDACETESGISFGA
jgi:hypothetical protein